MAGALVDFRAGGIRIQGYKSRRAIFEKEGLGGLLWFCWVRVCMHAYVLTFRLFGSTMSPRTNKNPNMTTEQQSLLVVSPTTNMATAVD